MNKDLQYKIKYIFRFLPDSVYLRIAFFLKFKRKLNLKKPTSFSEKLQWLKLNQRNDIFPLLVDKYRVKDYLGKIIGNEYIIQTLGVWDSFDEIDFDLLPSKFVLKCNHDSGGIVICKDKRFLDKEKAKIILETHLKRNYYWHGREWAYKNVQPVIIAEELIETVDGSDLKDYKFFCFNGKMKVFKVDCDRFSGHQAYYFDENLQVLPFSEKIFKPKDFDQSPKLPGNIKEMIELAEKIAEPLKFARVDFYSNNGKIYFGEITLYPASGMDVFDPEEWDYKLGSMLNLE